MKQLSDILQILLSLPGALGFIASALLVWAVWQLARSVGELLRLVRIVAAYLWQRLVRLTPGRVVAICILALPVYLIRFTVIDKLQYMEQVLSPAYVTGDTTGRAVAAYEAILEKHCDTWEAGIVKRRTREIAAKIGCSPLAIYEVAYSECGLNPFKVRDDGVAAGWIQFTRVGATGITTLGQVKAACKTRDVEKIMDWTEQYLLGRSGGKPLPDATAVYVCVFAPGFVGADDGKVLYQGWNNPAYSMNAIFDGYYLDEKGRIFRSRDAMDGKITIGELRLHLEAKKARVLRR